MNVHTNTYKPAAASVTQLSAGKNGTYLPNNRLATVAQRRQGIIMDGVGYMQDNRPKVIAQRKQQEATPNSQSIVQKKPNNTGLSDTLKAGVENLSGYSMDDVKVHYNSSQPAQLQALAYAQGTDIHLAPGQEKHLPHEAWHVVQQKQGRVKPTLQMKTGVNLNDDKGLEEEADRTEDKIKKVSSSVTLAESSQSSKLTSHINYQKNIVQRVLQINFPSKPKTMSTPDTVEWLRQQNIMLRESQVSILTDLPQTFKYEPENGLKFKEALFRQAMDSGLLEDALNIYIENNDSELGTLKKDFIYTNLLAFNNHPRPAMLKDFKEWLESLKLYANKIFDPNQAHFEFIPAGKQNVERAYGQLLIRSMGIEVKGALQGAANIRTNTVVGFTQTLDQDNEWAIYSDGDIKLIRESNYKVPLRDTLHGNIWMDSDVNVTMSNEQTYPVKVENADYPLSTPHTSYMHNGRNLALESCGGALEFTTHLRWHPKNMSQRAVSGRWRWQYLWRNADGILINQAAKIKNSGTPHKANLADDALPVANTARPSIQDRIIKPK